MYIPSIRPGRIASAIAAAVMTASLVAAPAYADSRVVATIGTDLTPAQKQTVIDYFGSNMNGADIIYVTNADEHAHLDGYIPYEQIGNATYSCALICPTTSGGIRVRAANLNYVTADMLAPSRCRARAPLPACCSPMRQPPASHSTRRRRTSPPRNSW